VADKKDEKGLQEQLEVLAEGLYELGQHVQALRRHQQKKDPWWSEFTRPSGLMAIITPLVALAVAWGTFSEKVATLGTADTRHESRLDEIDRWRLNRDETLSARFSQLESKVRADLMDQIGRAMEGQRATDQKIDRLGERIDRLIDRNLPPKETP
jgi:hypothetical protein